MHNCLNPLFSFVLFKLLQDSIMSKGKGTMGSSQSPTRSSRTIDTIFYGENKEWRDMIECKNGGLVIHSTKWSENTMLTT
jgi:hypothetical protein